MVVFKTTLLLKNDPKDIQLELTQAKSAIEQLLANDKADLAPVVRDELTAQKAALTKALDLIKQGKFDAAAANDPDMQKLTNVLQAIDSNDSNPPLPMDTVIQRQATLDALKSVTDDKSNMEKLEGALKDNPNYAHIFEKAPDGSYAFPDKLRDLISSKELEPEALSLLLNQANRAVEVIHSAKDREEVNLKANYVKGEGIHETGGRQGDFYSGYMALESLNTILQTSQDRGNLDPAEILNGIAKQQDVKAILDNPNQDERREALTQVMRTQNIEQGTNQVRKIVSITTLKQPKPSMIVILGRC